MEAFKTFKSFQYKYALQSRLKGSNDKFELEQTFSADVQGQLNESAKLMPWKEFRVINNPKYKGL